MPWDETERPFPKRQMREERIGEERCMAEYILYLEEDKRKEIVLLTSQRSARRHT